MNVAEESIGPTARLAETRLQLRQTLGAGLGPSVGDSPDSAAGLFPRSTTFRFLLGGSTGRNLGWLLLAMAATALPLGRHRGIYRSLGAMLISALAKRALSGRRRTI